MRAQPIEVRVDGSEQRIEASIDRPSLDPVQLSQVRQDGLGINFSPHDWDDPLVMPDGVGHLAPAFPRHDRVRAQDEHERIRLFDAGENLGAPLGRRRDIRYIDPGVATDRTESGSQFLDEVAIYARIRNEDLWHALQLSVDACARETGSSLKNDRWSISAEVATSPCLHPQR